MNAPLFLRQTEIQSGYRPPGGRPCSRNRRKQAGILCVSCPLFPGHPRLDGVRGNRPGKRKRREEERGNARNQPRYRRGTCGMRQASHGPSDPERAEICTARYAAFLPLPMPTVATGNAKASARWNGAHRRPESGPPSPGNADHGKKAYARRGHRESRSEACDAADEDLDAAGFPASRAYFAVLFGKCGARLKHCIPTRCRIIESR